MPPIVFVDATVATVAGTDFTFVTPAKARAGDALFLLIATGGGLDILDNESAGDPHATKWELVQELTTASYAVYLFRRDLTDDDPEPAAHTGIFVDASPAAAACVVLRGVARPTPASGAANDETAVTVHAMPAQVLAVYSSLYLGLLVCTGTIGGFTPAGATAVLSNDAARTIGVFYNLPEAPGSIALAPTTSNPRTGVVASFRLDAGPTLGAGLSLALDPVGAPGLPLEGI